MSLFPRLSAARFSVSGDHDLPDYLLVHDALTGQTLPGRRLPRLRSVGDTLRWWMGTAHPNFHQLTHFSDTGTDYLAVFAPLIRPRALAGQPVMPNRVEVHLALFAQLASACNFLSDRGRWFPRLDLSRIFLTEGGVRILGHETAQHPADGDDLQLPDLRYAAPELVGDRLKTDKSDIYQLGALFLHYLTGKAPTGTQKHDLDAIPDRLQATWQPLLERLLQPVAARRPTWAEFWEMFFAVCPLRRRPRPQPVWLSGDEDGVSAYLSGRLAACREVPQAVALQRYTGPRSGPGLMPFVYHAEEAGYMVFHAAARHGKRGPFEVTNEFLSLLHTYVLPHVSCGAPVDLPTALTDWQPRRRGILGMRRFFSGLVQDLVEQGCRGLVLLIEDVQDMARGDLQTLLRAVSWMARGPVMLVLTGDSFHRAAFRRLRDRGALRWTFHTPAPLDAAAARERFWLPTNPHGDALARGLVETAGEEHLLCRWMADRFYRSAVLTAYLEQVWQDLTPEERAVMQLFAASYRPLCAEDLAMRGAPRASEAALQRLARARFLQSDDTGMVLHLPVLRRLVLRKMSTADLRAVRGLLLAHEERLDAPDLVQRLGLTHHLHSTLPPELLAEARDRVYHAYDTALLVRLCALHMRENHAAFKEFYIWTEILKGKVVGVRDLGRFPALAETARGAKYRKKADPQTARVYLGAASTRAVTPMQKAFCLVQAAEAALSADNSALATRAHRRLVRLKPALAGADELWLPRTLAVLLQLGLSPKLPRLQSPMGVWLQAWVAWREGAFDTCLNLLEQALPHLQHALDLNWRGNLFKFYGNALFRNYAPKRAFHAYQRAAECFAQTQNHEALGRVAFNTAAAETLIGRFDSARTTFSAIHQQAAKAQDLVTCTEALYHLLVCDLFQNDMDAFVAHRHEHNRVALATRNVEEQLKSHALALHNAAANGRVVNTDTLKKMARLVETGEFPRILLDEVAVARRLAHFALGLADVPAAEPVSGFTQWRHQLVDYLVGKPTVPFETLVDTIGSGYLGACHFFLLNTVIEAGLLPQQDCSPRLAAAFKRHMSVTNAAYGALLRRRFGGDHSLQDLDRGYWEEALRLFDDLTYPPAPTFREDVLKSLAVVWPFQSWGVLTETPTGRQTGYEPASPDEAAVKGHLDWLGASCAEPLVTVFSDGHGGSRSLLVLPVGRLNGHAALLWATGEHTPSKDLSHLLKPLFRFYGKLLSLTFSDRKVEAPRGVVRKNFGIVGRSPALMGALEKIALYGKSNLNIYIWGESGTGKELAAKALHLCSNRAHRPYRTVNCSHFSENLVESELFGHIKGAFTGAHADRIGQLETADGGTLFLDEVGDLSPKVQSLLLRVLQEGEFSRVGESQVRKVDIRFVTATNKDLKALIAQGSFREDLYFRMVEEEIQLPPLRRRLEDLPDLVAHFAAKYQPGQALVFEQGFFRHLRAYHWPGNIRELESYIRKLLVRRPNATRFGERDAAPFMHDTQAQPVEEMPTLEAQLNRTRRDLVRQRLEHFGGNRSQTARSLGVTRQAIVKIIDRYQLR